MSDHRPQKRARTGSISEEHNSKVEITRGHPWHDDGNIVIQGCDGTQFRVHRSVLCNVSTIFVDMFAIPPPPDLETVEGCPLVVLPDTSAEVQVLVDLVYPYGV